MRGRAARAWLPSAPHAGKVAGLPGYGYYRCSFAAHKGPAVCPHGAYYRQALLEGLLLARFREATTPPMLDALTTAVGRRVEDAFRARDDRTEALKGEMLRLEQEAGHLVRFLRAGESGTVREELTTIESALQGLRVELAAERPAPPSVSRAWIQARVDQLVMLVATDPVRARTEIRKHLDGDLELVPMPQRAGPVGRVARARETEQPPGCPGGWFAHNWLRGGRLGWWANPLPFGSHSPCRPAPVAPPKSPVRGKTSRKSARNA